MNECCTKEIKRGKSPKYVADSGTLVFAQKCNTKYEDIDMRLALYLDESTLSKYSDDEYLCDKDIVINSTGTGTLGRVGIFSDSDNIRKFPIVSDSHVTVIRGSLQLNLLYLYIYLKSQQAELEKLGEGSTNQKELKAITLKNLNIPIPPYNEQCRISDLISSLFSILDDIKKSLN